jgi:hypothetical protein
MSCIRMRFASFAASLAASLALLSGCTALGPLQAWGLVKVADFAGNTALNHSPASAINTIHHADAPLSSVCIEYNPLAQLEDLVPAIQQALVEQGVTSRVYPVGSGLQDCKVWLRYAATIEWGSPPMSNNYRAYLTSASLSLHRADGALLSSSAYAIDPDYGVSRWSTTQRKLAPVVKAILTGFTS